MGSVVVAGARTPIGKLLGGLSGLSAVELGGLAIAAALERAGLRPDQVDYVVMGQVLQAGSGQIPARQAAVRGRRPDDRARADGQQGLPLRAERHRPGRPADPRRGVRGRGRRRHGVDEPGAAPAHRLAGRPPLRAGDDARPPGPRRPGGRLHRPADGRAHRRPRHRRRPGQPGRRGRLRRPLPPAGARRHPGRPVRRGDRRRARCRSAAARTSWWRPTRGSARASPPSRSAGCRRRSRPAARSPRARPARSRTARRPSSWPAGRPPSGWACRCWPRSARTAWWRGPTPRCSCSRPTRSTGRAPRRGIGRRRPRPRRDQRGLRRRRRGQRPGAGAGRRPTVDARVNVNGGAVALGHPIGASGARLVLTLALELARRGGGTGVAALCGGGGQGDALVLRVPGRRRAGRTAEREPARSTRCWPGSGPAGPRAVGRLISLVEDGSDALPAIMAALAARHRPGLRGRADRAARAPASPRRWRPWCAPCGPAGERVGVLAVDPTSPFTGGALLGDRVRMQEHALDGEVLIRSMATRGQLGGLAVAAPQALRVLDAAGCATVVVETVGVGQSEVDVAAAADVTVVLLAPGMGDGGAGGQGRDPRDRGPLRREQGRPRRRPAAGPRAALDGGAGGAAARARGSRRCSPRSPARGPGSRSCSARSTGSAPHQESTGEQDRRRAERARREIEELALATLPAAAAARRRGGLGRAGRRRPATGPRTPTPPRPSCCAGWRLPPG